MLSTKQNLIHYLEFLKENGFLYMEGAVGEIVPARDADMSTRSANPPQPVPAPAAPSPKPQSHQPPPATAPRRPAAAPTPPAAQPALPLAPKLPPDLEAGVDLPRAERIARLHDAADRAAACRACPLGERRNKLVYSDGDPEAKIMFIGEAPGAEEDASGKPFVGAAGRLLNKMIAAIGIKREEIFICNTLKCRPPNNRDPFTTEKAACEHFLVEQIRIVRPQIIVALGAHAAQYLCRSAASVTRLRGHWHSYQGVPLMATYHPAYLLRQEEKGITSEKRLSWEDFQKIHAKYCELNPDDQRKLWTKGDPKQ